MSSEYPVLDDRPIEQRKVSELKEELRKRGSPISGPKEELVRRLGEAIRKEKEMEAIAEGEQTDGCDPVTDIGDNNDKDEVEKSPAEDDTEVAMDKEEKTSVDGTTVDADNSTSYDKPDINPQERDVMLDTISAGMAEEMAVNTVSGKRENVTIKDILIDQVDPSNQVSRDKEISVDSKPEDVKLSHLEPKNQVSEVSHVLEFQVKCESISSDFVPINEKNELKDNFTANNFPLELEVVKSEMVHSSSGNFHGDVHPFNGHKVPSENLASSKEIDVKHATQVSSCMTMDGSSPGKLSLDRSSGDESMEEDVPENEHMESQNTVEVGEKTEADKVTDVIEQSTVVAEVGSFAGVNITDEEMQPSAPVKRQPEVIEIKEPVKRQRQWNPEAFKAPELQASNLVLSSVPKYSTQPTPRHTITRSASTLGAGSPKDCVVPPSQKPATTSLRIDRFLRPFTLKAVRELLSKTGSVCYFWMDQIKTHCYVTYTSVEEAIATRNAVYNLQWPTNGGRLLVAEFVDPQEVKIQVEAPLQAAALVTPRTTTPTAPSIQQHQHPQPSPHQQVPRQLLPPQPASLPPLLPNPPRMRERFPPPPPLLKKPEPPVMTLDDLFLKTKATPRIYYRPLSEEEVAAKLGVRCKSSKE